MTIDLHRRAFVAAAALGLAGMPKTVQAQAKPLMVVQWGAAWGPVVPNVIWIA